MHIVEAEQLRFSPKHRFDSNQERAKLSFNNFVPQYRNTVYQQPMYANYPQPSVSSNEILMQKRIEQFTQQMTSAMANLQNFVRSEIGGIKQRINVMENKLEELSKRRTYESEFDKYPQTRYRPGISESMLYGQTGFDSLPQPIFQSEFKSSSIEIPPKPLEYNDDWSTILALVQQEEINQAYSLAFKKGDDVLLHKLMGRTGTCLEKLDEENLERTIKYITITLSNKSFVDSLIPWVNQF